MTPPPRDDEYPGPERRARPPISRDLERELIEFMARTDERNRDKDLAHAVQDEVCAVCQSDIESLKASRTFCKGVLKAIFVYVPAGAGALASVVYFFIEVGKVLKEIAPAVTHNIK